jgi:8-oxo-dGTP pyrophosphatase MutT (NUDIX family)
LTASGTPPDDLSTHLSSRLATLPIDPLPPERADAAVLILIRLGEAGLEILAEQRAEQPGDPWSGQVGLPGGHREFTDHSLTETVLREVHEEVGILPSALEEPPRLFDVRRARPSGLRVAVFVDRLLDGPGGPRDVDPAEVTTTFWFPLHALDQTESRPRSTMFGQIYVDTVVFEGHVVWGFTLRLLQDFFSWLERPESPGSSPPGELHSWRSQAI